MNRMGFIHHELAKIREGGLYRTPKTLDGAAGPRATVDGRDMLLLCSNSYLGLGTHPEVVAAAQQAQAKYGTASGASRLISGTTRLHTQLEAHVARFKGTEDAVVFGTGYQANLGVLSTLAGPDDLIIGDELNHASLIDAMRLSRARSFRYAHRDVGHLERLLESERIASRRCIVASDGLFSMDGDLAPVHDIANLCRKHDAVFLLDDAHGTAVLGSRGRGTVEHLDQPSAVDLHVGTLSKALASQGGFVAGSSELCDLLRNRARSFVFSTAPTPASMAAADAALDLVEREPARMQQLADRAHRFRQGLDAAGLRVGHGPSPIVPIHVGPIDQAMAFSKAAWDGGVFAPAIRPPTVPHDTCRIRASLMATHTRFDVDEAAAVLVRAAESAGVSRRIQVSS